MQASTNVRIWRHGAFTFTRKGRGPITIDGVDCDSPEYCAGLRNGFELLHLQTEHGLLTFTSIPAANEALDTAPLPYWIAVACRPASDQADLPIEAPSGSQATKKQRTAPRNTTTDTTCASPLRAPPYHHRMEPTLTLEYGRPCEHCGFRWFTAERKLHKPEWCCDYKQRTVPDIYPPMPHLPEAYAEFLLRRQLHLNSKSVNYNNYFALAAIGISPTREHGGEGFIHFAGPSFIKIQGRIYHRLLDARFQGQVQFLIYDAAAGRQAADAAQLNRTCTRTFREYLLDNNVHFKSLLFLATQTKHYNTEEIGVRLSSNQHINQIAAVVPSYLHERQTAKTVVIYNRATGQPEFLDDGNELYEPLSYPILFPTGEPGWSRQRKKRLPLLRYLRTRLLMPDPSLTVTLPEGARKLTLNRFDVLPRLGQVYFVDGLSRVLDDQLRWVETHQNDIHGPDFDTARTIVPESVHGSYRHRRALTLNALTLLTKHGKPTIFLTLTCNPRWEEITAELLPGQTAYDRPALTARVFNCKLRILLDFLRSGELFGPAEYEIRVIEFQQRGLPHCHLVMRFQQPQAAEDAMTDQQWIDHYIHATIPEDPALQQLVTEHMVHHHLKLCTADDGTCTRGFPKPMAQETSIDSHGYPQYRRPTLQDTNIVPYNPTILQLWQGHANMEYAASVNIVLYLYKYIYKGTDHTNFTLHTTNEVEYLRNHRYLSSEESVWHILGYQTYPAIHPSVVRVKVHLPRTVTNPSRADEQSHLLRYFQRPNELRNHTLVSFYEKYMVSNKLPKRARRHHFTKIIEGKAWYYYERDPPVLARIQLVYPTAGELWFLRLICLHRPVCSFKDARTTDGVTFSTFQEAARAARLLTNHDECIIALNECCEYKTPRELRALFVMLTLEGYPTLHALDNDAIVHAMQADLQQVPGIQHNHIARQELLQDLQCRFDAEGKDMQTYGLPLPAIRTTEREYQQALYPPLEQLQRLQHLPPLTAEQQTIYNHIMEAVNNTSRKGALFFVQGRGGSGKSFLMNRILLATRANREIALVCASTALAASVYDGGVTAHSLFKLPVREDPTDQEPLTPHILPGSDRADLLRHARVIIWDEFPNSHRELFEMVHAWAGGFPNTVFIGCGDFRQIPPVVQGGGRLEITYASITRSELWQQFEVLNLLQSVRDRDDPVYAELVLQIGNGAHRNDNEQNADDNGQSTIDLPLEYFTKDTETRALRFVFPAEDNDSSPKQFAGILAATNDLVDSWNTKVQELNPEAPTVLHSADALSEADNHRHKLRIPIEYLNSLHHSQVPPHALHLKPGDICLLMRNLSQTGKLANNQRVRILQINRFTVRVQLLADNSLHTIPRIHFYIRLPKGSYEVRRTQFPIKLAYATTYNKAQGQTMKRALVDITKAPFTHGHLYVALSRVATAANIAVYCSPEQVQPQESGQTTVRCTNVFWPELIPNQRKIENRES